MLEQNAETLINQDPDKIQKIFIEQIDSKTRKTIGEFTIRKIPIFEYLGIDNATPRK